MENQFYELSHDAARRNAAQAVLHAPERWTVRIEEPKKKRIQEEKYHAMIGDIAGQTTYAGRKWDQESMKRILTNEFEHEMRLAGTPLRQTGVYTPTEDGTRVIQLGIQTRNLLIGEAAQFIEFLYAYGAERHVIWGKRK